MANVICPYCNAKDSYEITDNNEKLIFDVYDMEDEEELELICLFCNKIFDIECCIEIIKEVEYFSSEKPQPEEIIVDYPGQMFFWEDLDLGGIKIY